MVSIKKNKRRKTGAKIEAPVVFFTVFPNKKSAVDFAQIAIKNKWAACINIIDNMTSIYEWDGQLKVDPEFLVIGKTTTIAFRKLKVNLPTFHPYEVPELISFKITDGLPVYLQWVREMVKNTFKPGCI